MRVLYLIFGNGEESYAAFKKRVVAFADENLTAIGDAVTVAVTEEPPPRFSVIPFRRDKAALISLNGVSAECDWPASPPGFGGAYESETAWPVLHKQEWPMGQRSPGSGLLTLFRKKKKLPEAEFIERWYEGHTPLTLEVHPNVGYVRNRVLTKVEKAGIPEKTAEWNGIVEEQYDPPEQLLNPRLFFGGALGRRVIPTMLAVYRDVKGFIDYSSIRTWLTREYRLKDAAVSDEAAGA